VLQYTQLCAKQDEKCPICDKNFPAVETIGVGLVIDHDHVTGHNRGILCSSCNVGLGCFGDNPESLKRAIVYLAHDDSLDTNVDTSVAPSDSILSLVATLVRLPAVAAAKVPPPGTYNNKVGRKVPQRREDPLQLQIFHVLAIRHGLLQK
jgi:hypothetical protein